MGNLLMSWGLRYLKAGWSIIPIQTKSKLPLIDWKEFQTRRASEAELRSWLQKWPEMNLGIVTGNISSLVVVDLDGPKGLQYGRKMKLGGTVVSLTGTGKHIFYRWAEGLRNSASKIAEGVDIRGEGGYVVVAPSTHPSGRMYRWERFAPDLIPDFPLGILAVTNAENTSLTPLSKPDNWLSEALEEMKNGHVHNTLVSVLGKFRAHNFSELDTCRLLQPHALENGKPFQGLEAKIHEIWGRYEPANRESPSQGVLRETSYSGNLSIKSPTNDNDFEQFESNLRQYNNSDSERFLQTGFPTLDGYFEGGLKSERLFTWAARTGTGKTNIAVALAYNLCKQDKKVLYFSTEFKTHKIWSWFYPYCQNSEEFRKCAFYVCDSFKPSIEQIEKALQEIKPDIFIFDYIQHVSKDKDRLTEFMQSCQFLQQKYDCQGIILAQLGRSADWVENGKRVEPRMDMIECSSSIEESSSRVLLLSTTREDAEKKEITGILAKNDQGDCGMVQFGLYKHPFILKELV